MRFAYAADREIGVWVLDYLLGAGFRPSALLTPDPSRASHAAELTDRCNFLPRDRVFHGAQAFSPGAIESLRGLNLDVIVGVHFPLIVPQAVLDLPRQGMLNLHPAYLPYNRGWHTASWAILDQTPIGATLHFMDAGVDTGDVVHQRALDVLPSDTAHTLYQRLLRLELEVFKEAWPAFAAGNSKRRPQDHALATVHKRRDLLDEAVQRIDLDAGVKAGDLIRRLRALTTDRWEEAAYFEAGGKRYRVRVEVREEKGPPQ